MKTLTFESYYKSFFLIVFKFSGTIVVNGVLTRFLQHCLYCLETLPILGHPQLKY